MKKEISLGRFLVRIFLMFAFLIWLALKCADGIEVKAAVITGETHLGGFAKAIDEYIKAGGETYTKEDLEILSAAMELENGCNSDECLLYTGSVIINRKNKHWANSIEGVILQGYHDNRFAQQYASHTVENLRTVKVSERCRKLAIQLILYGPIDSEVVYQSQYRHLGTRAFCINGEWFAYEEGG